MKIDYRCIQTILNICIALEVVFLIVYVLSSWENIIIPVTIIFGVACVMQIIYVIQGGWSKNKTNKELR